MLALVLASLSSLEDGGEPGDSFRGGKHNIAWAEAIGFEFLLVTLSRTIDQPHHVIAYGDNISVIESCVLPLFTPSECNPADAPSQGTYAHQIVNSHLYPSLSIFTSLSSTPPTPLPPLKSKPSETGSTRLPLPNSLTALYVSKNLLSTLQPTSENLTTSYRIHSPSSSQPKLRFNPLITPSHIPDPRPHPYKPDLTPLPSTLHPHCLTRQCLLMWQPTSAPPRSTQSNNDKSLSDQEIERILSVIGASWSESTKELYGTGLLIFHVYCDINNIPDHRRAPVSANTFTAFLSSCAGAYSGSTVANYAATVKAWHLLHGMEWTVKDAEYKALLEGATRLAPSSSKRPKCAPFTVDILEKFSLFMNLDDLREFTVPAISKFNPSKHITRAGFALTQNHKGLPIMQFSLPSTKTSREGEEVHCAPHDQDSRLDPKGALDCHFCINTDR
ncbi:hypothetical protein PAXRUDRAFT_17898 [Paxillus rubicundulus Ve08.2h10]|uniref:Core-binding (CB) domain-containing protein n=1 Tax=Paxillus rubicundulus Ve08.2h10 TaxID=930991 RepID=A0A0D0CNK2_9AGAM|nr:hypothetical protein PAXRUDRAFT_17898 [Paxillus rubicundulus Ve08.2h10]